VIEELHIRDLALIEEAWLELSEGLTVLTGETGAGKTVLLSALKLMLGERADSSAVRHGAAEAVVEGRFVLSPSETSAQSADAGDSAETSEILCPEAEDGHGEIVVSRRVSSEGRSRCVLNGSMVSVGTLERCVGPAVDLHGQHDHQALLRPASHIGYLDRFGAAPVEDNLTRYRESLGEYRARTAELEEIERGIARSAEELAVNRLILEEIDRVDPAPHEDDEIETALPAMQHAEEIARSTTEARSLISGDGGAAEQVAAACSALDRVAEHVAEIAEVAASLRGAGAALDDAGFSLGNLQTGRFDEDELNVAMSRLAALDGLKKRFGPSLEAVIERRESLRRSLEIVEAGEDAVADARNAQLEAEQRLRAAAAELLAVRTEVAGRFRAAVLEQTAGLELGSIRFEVSFSEVPFERWSESGSHAVEFLYSPVADMPARPLAKIASGGEISRVMLALKTVLGPAGGASTLVFDEIDAGIGGSTATAVGERLANLSRGHQVLVVTHLAQVAAFADTHYVVRKVEDDSRTATVVVPVEGEQRVRELARMLAGDETEVALSHARELLAQRGSVR